MVVAQHIGRAGNNLFQIAAAIGYAKKFGYRWGVDPGSGLGAPYSAIHKVFPNLPKTELVYRRKYHEHPSAFCNLHGSHYDVCHFDYHPFRDDGANVTLFGFWQTLRYFEEAQEEVKKVFALDFISGYEDFTSVHVRRGDYVQHSGSFPPVTADYVRKAVQILGADKILVFSDDINWCIENLIEVPSGLIEFCNEQDERRSLSLMASCGNHIIANSSYSWWGGYLGHNPEKKIVSPSHKRGNWFGMESGIKKDATDLIPKEWIEVEFR
jgi:hypothetical protein